MHKVADKASSQIMLNSNLTFLLYQVTNTISTTTQYNSQQITHLTAGTKKLVHDPSKQIV